MNAYHGVVEEFSFPSLRAERYEAVGYDSKDLDVLDRELFGAVLVKNEQYDMPFEPLRSVILEHIKVCREDKVEAPCQSFPDQVVKKEGRNLPMYREVHSIDISGLAFPVLLQEGNRRGYEAFKERMGQE